MGESKSETWRRLRASGEWEEADKFLQQARSFFRGEGFTRAAAGEAAWNLTATVYPPDPEISYDDLSEDDGWVLPQVADAGRELRWVASEFTRIGEKTVRGVLLHLDRARSAPPSLRTLWIAMWACENPAVFPATG